MAEAKVQAEVPAEVAVVTPEGLRRRRRLEVSRERLTVRLSAEELSEIGVAARWAGLTRSGFVASAAVRAARGVVVGEATRALDDVGVNLNQAVRRLHSTGVAPAGLGEAVAAVQAGDGAGRGGVGGVAAPAGLTGRRSWWGWRCDREGAARRVGRRSGAVPVRAGPGQ